MLDFDSDEKERMERANQIFLRLRRELHDREAQFAERDVEEAAQSARWLREIIEQHPTDWEQAYEDALAESELTEEDVDYLRRGAKEAGGFLPFVQRNLQRLEGAVPDEGEQTNAPTREMSHQGHMTHKGLVCGAVAGILAGGVMTGNSFYFGFGVGMSRKAGCW